MSRTTPTTSVRRRLPASIGASAMVAFALTVVASPAIAAPSGNAQVIDGTLRVTGSRTADRLALRLRALDPTKLQVDFGDDGSAEGTFALDTFSAIAVDGGHGDDTIRIDQVNGAFTTTEPTVIAGGRGDDTLVGGSGAEVFLGGRGDDVVDGNGGRDTAFLGNGDDVFIWDPGDASDVVEGESGSDSMVFNGAGGDEVMAADADGGRVRFTRNLGGIVMDLDGVEMIDVRALGGVDTVSVNDVRGTALERVDVDLAAALAGSVGDGTADGVTVVATDGDDSITAAADGAAVEVSGLTAEVRITNADPGSDVLTIDKVGGVDEVTIDPAAAALIIVSVK
jgi:hypothetical protein